MNAYGTVTETLLWGGQRSVVTLNFTVHYNTLNGLSRDNCERSQVGGRTGQPDKDSQKETG
jgi:hypothetical protein